MCFLKHGSKQRFTRQSEPDASLIKESQLVLLLSIMAYRHMTFPAQPRPKLNRLKDTLLLPEMLYTSPSRKLQRTCLGTAISHLTIPLPPFLSIYRSPPTKEVLMHHVGGDLREATATESHHEEDFTISRPCHSSSISIQGRSFPQHARHMQ